ncbi:phage portal protein [Lacrimispora indolis]|uniref:phage portal protein n=1 Tax=Lacrimispora indolis TaxID=69825 RepID=UPI00040E3FA0|nr:phage portal protein [[Clostridium] methoxybenzovorans]
MGRFSFSDLFKRNKEIAELAIAFDFEELDSRAQRVYLKRMALDICANFIARAIGQSEFKVNNKLWHYKLNVRPNTDLSAAQFWEQLVYKLIVDNHVLVVLSDTDDLLIADGWTRNEYAVYEDTFEGVTVKGYTFERTFRMGEVLYLEYNNQKLERFTNGLFDDYSELYCRMMEAAKRNNQIRGSVSINANTTLDEKKQTQLQEYIDKLFQAFQNRSIAIAPLIKGFEYEEYSNTTGTSNIKVEEVTKIPDTLIDIVADAVGIPTALLHGTRAELKDNMIAFNKYCLPPLLKKIEDELNAKIIEKEDYIKGERVEVWGINRPDIFELAEPIDKLVSSSTFNVNELRKELGHKPREGGDVYVKTKNYEYANATEQEKGGEDE